MPQKRSIAIRDLTNISRQRSIVIFGVSEDWHWLKDDILPIGYLTDISRRLIVRDPLKFLDYIRLTEKRSKILLFLVRDILKFLVYRLKNDILAIRDLTDVSRRLIVRDLLIFLEYQKIDSKTIYWPSEIPTYISRRLIVRDLLKFLKYQKIDSKTIDWQLKILLIFIVD